MKNNLKIGLAVAFVLVMSLAVAGCTSNNSTSSSDNSGQALTMTAVRVEPTPASVTTYYGDTAVMVNATINNNNAGTFKVSSDDFYMQDSSGHVLQPLGATKSSVLHDGEWVTSPLLFQLPSGMTVSQLEYNDGTHDLTCTVD